jgi:hypothetical protein
MERAARRGQGDKWNTDGTAFDKLRLTGVDFYGFYSLLSSHPVIARSNHEAIFFKDLATLNLKVSPLRCASVEMTNRTVTATAKTLKTVLYPPVV